MTLDEAIEKVDELHKKWQSLQPLSEEADDKLWQKLRLEWNYNSNHIEGNTLTYGETMLLLMSGITTGDHLYREYEEMKAHDLAVHLVKEWAADPQRELTESDIRELNKTILVRPFWKDALTRDGDTTRRMIKIGAYKEYPNSVRTATGEIFHYATPEETPQQMSDLMEWYRKNQDVHQAVLAAEMHYRFVRIHPFDDGNGRIARLLVNYILMRNGYPPTVIKSEQKSAYLTALQKADAGDREAFQTYLCEQVIWALHLGIRAGEGKSVEEEEDLDKEISLLKRDQKTRMDKKRTEKNLKQEILQNVFMPMLVDSFQHLLKFHDLFEAGSWYYFKDPNAINSELVDTNLIEIQGVLSNQLEGRNYSSFLAVYRYLNRFDERKWNLDVGFKLKFAKDDYSIEIFIGGPNRTFQSVVMNSKFLGKPGPNDKDSLIVLAESDYYSAISKTDIKEWAKQIGREILQVIKRAPSNWN